MENKDVLNALYAIQELFELDNKGELIQDDNYKYLIDIIKVSDDNSDILGDYDMPNLIKKAIKIINEK